MNSSGVFNNKIVKMSFSNTPDKFFTSGGDPNVLIALMSDLRESLLSLNKFNPNNTIGVFDPDTLVRFAKIRTMAYNYQTNSAFTMNAQNDNVAASVKQSTTDAEKIQAVNQNDKQTLDTQLTTIRATYNDQINKTFGATADKVATETSTIDDQNYTFPINKPWANLYKKVSYTISGSNTVPTTAAPLNGELSQVNIQAGVIQFPQHGQDYDNHSAELSNELVNNVEQINFRDQKTGALTPLKDPSGAPVYKGWGVKSKKGWVSDPIKTYTKDTPFTDQINKTLQSMFNDDKNEPAGTIKFFIEKLHGRYGDGTPYKKGKVTSQIDKISPENLSNRMVFSAYIENFNDQTNVRDGSYNLMGRSEAVPIYKGTDRSFNLVFSIIADYSLDIMRAMQELYKSMNIDVTNEEQIENLINRKDNWGLGYIGLPQRIGGTDQGGMIPGMYSDSPESLWHKLTFLSQCCYPYYRSDGKMKEQPIIRIRVGDFYDVTGMISNYSIDMGDLDNMIDLNPSAIGAIPFSVKITLAVKIIHENEPNSDYWGFYHRREFDNGTANMVNGAGLAKEDLSITTKAEKQKTTAGKLDKPKELQTGDIGKQNEVAQLASAELQKFKVNYDKATAVGINIPNEVRKINAENSMKSFVRINDIVEQLKTLYNYSSMNPLDVLKNTSGISDTLQTIRDNKNTFDQLYGGVTAAVNNVSQQVNKADSQLKQYGINVGKSTDIQNIVENINKYKPQNIVPKTLGDILGK